MLPSGGSFGCLISILFFWFLFCFFLAVPVFGGLADGGQVTVLYLSCVNINKMQHVFILASANK